MALILATPIVMATRAEWPVMPKPDIPGAASERRELVDSFH